MRRVVLALVVLAALGASACGGSEPTAEPVTNDAVALAASKTTDAGTYKADMTASIETAGQTVKMSGTGAFDSENQRGRMSLTNSVAGQDIDMEVVYALPVLYMRFPPGLIPGVSAEQPWLKLDLEQAGKEEGFDFGQILQAGQTDPSQGLEFLQGAQDTKAVGEEEVRGVPTTHYTAVVDLAALGDENPALKDAAQQLVEQMGVSRIPIEAWIDEDGFVRRVKQTMRGASSLTGQSIPMDMTTTTEFYDFGTEVSVEEPPADEVVDLQELTGQS